jgi:hypothetical protein
MVIGVVLVAQLLLLLFLYQSNAAARPDGREALQPVAERGMPSF